MGRAARVSPAQLAGHAVCWADGQSFPILTRQSKETAQGVLTEPLTDEDAARLDFYEGGFDYGIRDVTVEAGGKPVPARVYMPGQKQWQPGARWDLAAWRALWGDVVTQTARDFMALYGQRDPGEILARYPQMLVRGASALRAGAGGPATLRRAAGQGDVTVARRTQPYAHFFSVEEYDLNFRRFDGSFSDTVNRAVFVSGDAATVLPYDPMRDCVLVIEQFRPGPFARGDGQPWLLEPIAGRVDADETPEAAARREASEEAGLTIETLLPIASYYPSPAAKAEYLYSFLGLADLPDTLSGGVSGVAGEHEDIRTHIIPFDRLMQLVEIGEAENGPLLLSALFLARHRNRLRSPA